jgi:hypothetical protein
MVIVIIIFLQSITDMPRPKGPTFTPGMTTTLRASVCVFVIFLILFVFGALLAGYHFLLRPSVGSIVLPRRH